MRGAKKSREEMEAFLREMSLGTLALCEGPEPYAVPINFVYDRAKIVLHCAHEGKKIDFLRANPRVCFVVARQDAPVVRHGSGDVCHLPSMSVVCHGRARIVDDPGQRAKLLDAFLQRYAPGAPPLPRADVEACGCIEISVTEMTGRREGPEKGQLACWTWTFPARKAPAGTRRRAAARRR